MAEETANLSQAEHKAIYTTEEIKELGFKCNKKLPDPVKCKYCGRTLYYECIVLMNNVVVIRKTPQRCDCEKAQQYWNAVDAVKAEKAEKERLEVSEKKYRLRVKRSKIGKLHQNCSLNNYVCSTQKQKAAVRKATEYIKNFASFKAQGRGLYIEGTAGTGKTHFAAAISMELIKQGYSVIMQTQNDILATIKTAYDNFSDYSEEELSGRYKRVSLLVIDDLGKYPATVWGVAALYDIINYRYEEQLPTIITTNYNEYDLIKRLTTADGDSVSITTIISRLRQTTDVITMAWDDYRGGLNG